LRVVFFAKPVDQAVRELKPANWVRSRIMGEPISVLTPTVWTTGWIITCKGDDTLGLTIDLMHLGRLAKQASSPSSMKRSCQRQTQSRTCRFGP
jgi:hypothetical protein